MIEETIRPSEEEILVFISSRQDDELAEARAIAIETVDKQPGFRVWAFEDAPASSEAARDRYLRNAGKAEIVIWLVGSTSTCPVAEEIEACLVAGSRLLPFKLPAEQRDSLTQELVQRAQRVVTWRTVKNVKSLHEHIHLALTDELIRGFRDPAPMNHDQYLRYKLRQSLAETKRLWTTFGVPDDIATELAEDRSIGHKLELPDSGIIKVSAPQGSGKSLAALRLHQHAISNRLEDHLQPLPILLNARNIGGELGKEVEDAVRGQGNVLTQSLVIIIDGLDEVGRYRANQLLDQGTSYADANQNTAIVVMTRPLPGLKCVGESIVLSPCTDDEFFTLASKVAGRTVDGRDIPYRLSKTPIPLFAIILGTLGRDRENLAGRTLSQIVNQLVNRILEESEQFSDETAEPLKKLAVAATNSGGGVSKLVVDLRESVHQLLANSRLVAQHDGILDFTLAIFREWFAARSLVERTTDLEDVDLESDSWVVPIAIAINTGDSYLCDELMAFVAARDPGLASLILEEVRENWSAGESEKSPLSDTPKEIGRAIRHAMNKWGMGLRQLMPVIGPLDKDGSISSIAIRKGSAGIAAGWYGGSEKLPPVIEMTEGAYPFWGVVNKDWPSWKSGPIEQTRVWAWLYARETLSDALSEYIESLKFALESPIGVHEFTAESIAYLSRWETTNETSPLIEDQIAHIKRWIKEFEEAELAGITIDRRAYTKEEFMLIHRKLLEVVREGRKDFPEPWPGPNRPSPKGERTVRWHELYTEERLLERTKAIFDGALQIYKDIVSRRLAVFNKRHQMTYISPLRIEGTLRFAENGGKKDAILVWWRRPAKDGKESGVFFELMTDESRSADDTVEKIKTAREEVLKIQATFVLTSQILHDNGPRSATMLASEWLKADLAEIGWLGDS